MGMEMRACENTGLSQDLTPPISPHAVALHDSFLSSHCCSCFCLLPSQCLQQSLKFQLPVSSCAACSSVHYCSSDCFVSDCISHASSGECHFLSLNKLSLVTHADDTTDLRVALRLLHALEIRGLLAAHWTELPDRIGGLLVSDLEKVLEEGGEAADKIWEAGWLMSCARRKSVQGERNFRGAAMAEELAFWAVITNGVEVQISEGLALGVAVYGPRFSWFNHSCSPNACYRFELPPRSSNSDFCKSVSFSVFPSSNSKTLTEFQAWHSKEESVTHGFCKYGPRVVIRSIVPIEKGEEVCIAYIDLLQYKADRHFDLWSKYRFICCCKRCSSSQMYVDNLLSCDARNLNLERFNVVSEESEELADALQQAVAEYTSDGDPEECCDKLESLLFSSRDKIFKLHPLHHLSLTACMTLASAYRLRAQSAENNHTVFKMRRAASAYSLLLEGAVHHLFLFEPSLITITSHFSVSAGETILDLVRGPSWGSSFSFSQSRCTVGGAFTSCHELGLASWKFIECVSSLLVQCWPFLVQGCTYLEKIKSPVDFSWLGSSILRPQVSLGRRDVACYACTCRAESIDEEERWCLYKLAVHCLSYGMYLASICYGPHSYLVNRAKNLIGWGDLVE